jgi:hypothetical protein
MGLGDALKLRVGFAGAQDARIAEHRAIARDAWRIELVTPAHGDGVDEGAARRADRDRAAP